jgi:hypothetical protein
MRALFPVLFLFLLAGCQLVDQRTVATWFGGRPVAPGTADLAAATLPPLPLVVVRYDQAGFDPRPELAKAAEKALARKPDALFEVVTPLPTAAPLAEQDRFAAQGAADARAVADALATAGVSPDRIRLGLQGDPGQPVREVRVYVR